LENHEDLDTKEQEESEEARESQESNDTSRSYIPVSESDGDYNQVNQLEMKNKILTNGW